ncbi:MAG: ATP-grasp domain-containing protein [Gammaproteobacteria bacterium]
MTLPLIIAATSARVLAAAARPAYLPCTIDLFADRDTCALAARAVHLIDEGDFALPGEALLDAVDSLVGDYPQVLGLVYGSGLEGRPALLEALTRRVRVLGCNATVLGALADMPAVVARFDGVGDLVFPPTARQRPAAAAGWLAKQDGACGGGHVRDACTPGTIDGATYYQRYVAGPVYSAIFIAARGACVLCGVTRHLRAAPLAGAPFTWQGAVSVATPPVAPAMLERCGAALAGALGLQGGFGIDFVADAERVTVLDINPRLPASLEVYADRAAIFAAHVAACAHDTLLYSRPAMRPVRASVVLYAHAAGIVPPRFDWPREVADVPPDGSPIAAGAPLVSVIAEASCGDTILALLTARCRDLAHRLADRGAAVLASDITISTVGGCDV